MDTIKSGKFLYELRKEKNLNQKEVASIIGVSDKAISKWELGEGFPSIDYLVKLSQFYGVTVDEIIKGERNNSINLNNNQQVIKKSKTPFSIYQLLALLLGIIALFIYIIVMYVVHSLAGSTITLLVFSIITALLSVLDFVYDKNELDALTISNFLLVIFNSYLSLYSLGAMLFGYIGSVYIQGTALVVAICQVLPCLGFVCYSLIKNFKTQRTVKEMIFTNFNKYVDALIFTQCFVSLLIIAFNYVSARDTTSFIIVLVALGISMLLTLVDFLLKKEIPFLIPSIILVCSLAALFVNTADLFYLSVNAIGVIAVVTFVLYSVVFILKKKTKETSN